MNDTTHIPERDALTAILRDASRRLDLARSKTVDPLCGQVAIMYSVERVREVLTDAAYQARKIK